MHHIVSSAQRKSNTLELLGRFNVVLIATGMSAAKKKRGDSQDACPNGAGSASGDELEDESGEFDLSYR